MSDAFDIAIMLDDVELQRLVATWPKLTPEERKSVNAIADASNIQRSRIEMNLKRARIHKLINDDGTIHPVAEKYISTLVSERIAGMMTKVRSAQPKKPDAAKPEAKSKTHGRGKK